MNKLMMKGSTLLEVIISTFFVSVITLMIVFAIHSQLKISRVVKLRHELSNYATSYISGVIANESLPSPDENYTVNLKDSEILDNFYKVIIEVKDKKTNESISYIAYYEKN